MIVYLLVPFGTTNYPNTLPGLLVSICLSPDYTATTVNEHPVRLIDTLSAIPRNFNAAPIISSQGVRYRARYGLVYYKMRLLRG